MNINFRRTYCILAIKWIAFSFLLSIIPYISLAQSQEKSEERHATLLSWEGDIKRYILDRAHDYGGTHFERGLFRENIAPMSAEHELDLLTYRYTAMDDYRWVKQKRGYRLYFGSLNAKYFAIENHFKSQLGVGNGFNFGMNGVQLENLRAERFFVALNLEKQFAGNHTVGVYHTLTRAKSDLDAGLYYEYGNFKDGKIRLEATFLDWASGITEKLADESGMLGRWYDAVYSYNRHPFLLSATIVSPHSRHFRGEIVGGIQTPLDKTVTKPDSLRFRDQEWVHYLGALAEFSTAYITAGITYKRKFSKLLRRPTESSSYEPNFGNWQFSDEFGIYAAADPAPAIRLEQWMWYEFSTDRLQGHTLPEDFDKPFNYREKRLKVKSRILFDNRQKGVTTGLEFHADFRYPESEEERKAFPYYVQDRNERLTFTLGYRISPFFHFTGGFSYDLDRDRFYHKKDYTWFDGGFGRLVATW